MVLEYLEYDGLKVFSGSRKDKTKKNLLIPNEDFIFRLKNLGYRIMKHDDDDLIIIVKYADKHSQACVIYHDSRVLFTTNDFDLLKLVYVFVTFSDPNTENYNVFCLDTVLPYLTKNDFINELKNLDYTVIENKNTDGILTKIDIFADVDGFKNPKVGDVSGDNYFNMRVYDSQLLLCLFQYGLTPLDKR